MILSIMKIKVAFILTILLCFMIACSNDTTTSNGKSMDIFLQNSSQSSFVEFLYEFSGKNRLNVQWFGWHIKEEPMKWFERNDREASFKIGMFLLSENNGYFHFSNHLSDDLKMFFHLSYGDDPQKEEWIEVVEAFKLAIVEKGWRLEEAD